MLAKAYILHQHALTCPKILLVVREAVVDQGVREQVGKEADVVAMG